MSECEGFKWIGQALNHCDGCGKPYWEHTHESWRGELQPIKTEIAAGVKEHWTGKS